MKIDYESILIELNKELIKIRDYSDTIKINKLIDRLGDLMKKYTVKGN